MKAFNLKKEALFSGFQIVDSGAYEILKLQGLGYNYLRP
jgi:intracellular sulfur oxidation DsrE/DsrF family protein